MSPLAACTWKIALKYKGKQTKNGKFSSNYRARPIDFETQISLYRYTVNPSEYKPLQK